VLDAPGFIFQVPNALDLSRHASAGCIGRWTVFEQFGRVKGADLLTDIVVAAGCLHVALSDRPTFGIIALQDGFSSKAMKDSGKFPAQIGCITNSGVHAIAAGWNVLVRSIACEEDTTLGVAARNKKMRRPRIGHQDLCFDIPPDEPAKQFLRSLFNRLRIRKARM